MIKHLIQSQVFRNVIPAKAGIQKQRRNWIPAFAGMTRFYLVLFVTLVIFPPSISANETDKVRATTLYHQLRCVVCAGQSLAESHADMAVQMRKLVRKQIAQGMSDDEILDFFTKRYGDEILTTPPMNPYTWLLWIAPVMSVFLGLILWRASQKK